MRKNLIYHLAPFRNSDAWQRNLKQLLPRLGQFNGQRCVAVATGENLVPLSEIQSMLAGNGLDIFGVPNDPILRERASFPILLEKVCSLDPDEATFYAHAKGVSTVCSPEGSMYWRNLMYARLLDGQEKIESLLRRYPMVGTHKITRNDTFPDGLKTPWHFAGTFYWFRHDALFTRSWQDLPQSAWATEALPGLLFHPSDGFCLAMENIQHPYDPSIYCGADRIPDEDPGPPATAAVLVEFGGGQRPRGDGYINVDYHGGKLPWGDSTVDSVYASMDGRSVQEIPKLFEEFLRILKPGTILEVRTPHLFPIATKEQGGKSLRLVHKHSFPSSRKLMLRYYVNPVPIPEPVPIVVYHVACMGNWKEVVREQFLLLRESCLAAALSEIGDGVRLSHVGGNLQDVLDEAARQDVPVQVVSSFPDLQKFEIPAMLEIDRLAKRERVTRPILYMHTKGVSAPLDNVRATWRRAMGYNTVSKWRENLEHLKTHDAAGMDFWPNHPAHPHFHGTFWMATADWIRELRSFEEFNRTGGNGRFSAEIWIGKATRPCRAYSHLLHDEQIDVPGFDLSRIEPPPYTPAKTITWVSAANPRYYADLDALEVSAKLLGPGHQTAFRRLPQMPWKHTMKFGLLREAIAKADTTHVFWVDGDCQFLTVLRPEDFIGDKPLSCVRHLAYSDPRPIIPAYLQSRLPPNPGETYWQVCLWGGEKSALLEVLDGVKWFEDDPRGYDEHALNIWFCSHPEKVFTLPCRYAAPSSFAAMRPEEKTSYFERAGGAPRVIHHNSDISGRNR